VVKNNKKSKKHEIKNIQNLSFFRVFGGQGIQKHVSCSIQLLNFYYFAFN
jgi:hypothetical protein